MSSVALEDRTGVEWSCVGNEYRYELVTCDDRRRWLTGQIGNPASAFAEALYYLCVSGRSGLTK